MSEAGISALFVIWSLVSVVAGVPAGAMADRYSRRGALAAAGVLQAAAYAVWIAAPTFAGFAAGFVLWGVSGSLATGAFEALLYDGLASAGAEGRYAAVLGRAEAASLAVQVPVAVAASALAAAGGVTLAGLVSVAVCVAAAALATTLPDERREGAGDGRDAYLATLMAGVGEAVGSPRVRGPILAVAALAAFDGLEEYFPLLAARWGIPVSAIPLALLAVPLAGALGAALGWRAMATGPARLTLIAVAAAAAVGAAGLLARPAGIVGGVVFYGLWRLVLVVADARLQSRIEGTSRATVTSVAGIVAELSGIVLFAAWAVGGLGVVVALALLAAFAAPALLGRAGPGGVVAGPVPEAGG